MMDITTQPILEIRNLAVSFPQPGGQRVRVVQGVNLAIPHQQTLAIVGESGCGKSVTAMSILRLIPTPPAKYESGQILWRQAGSEVDLLTYSESQMRSVRGGQIAMIFQEPMTSLNPVFTIGDQILEAVFLHQKTSRRQAIDIAIQALADVGIADPSNRLKEYPHQLSGGMRQRVMIAMALACQPKLLLADEPTTALDVTIQAQILELLRELQAKRGMSVLLITHDLGVVAQNADQVAVMYAGRVVEYGPVAKVFAAPKHPYTQGLFESMPVLGSKRDRLKAIPGNVPDPRSFPPGCAFHPRCDSCQNDPACLADVPRLNAVGDDHWAACHHVAPVGLSVR